MDETTPPVLPRSPSDWQATPQVPIGGNAAGTQAPWLQVVGPLPFRTAVVIKNIGAAGIYLAPTPTPGSDIGITLAPGQPITIETEGAVYARIILASADTTLDVLETFTKRTAANSGPLVPLGKF